MPPSDQEPRYQLVDSNGNVVGSLFGDGSGNVVIADETDTQTTFGPDGITTPALEAERLNNNRIYAGGYSGADADARLDNAISDASDGDIIHLERDDYFKSRTISKSLKFIGVNVNLGISKDITTRLKTDWIFESFCHVSSINIQTDTSFGFTFNSEGMAQDIVSRSTASRGFIEANAVSVRIIGNTRVQINITSNADGVVVTGNSDVAISDSGTNTQLGANS